MRDRGVWLAPLSRIYRLVVAIRNRLFDWGWRKSYRAGCPVISVGNLTAGGSGKTPLVLKLLEHFNGEAAVLSRGYKSEAEKKPPQEVELPGSPALYGDEPLLIKEKFPQSEVWVGAKRRLALPKVKAPRIILDDGFQHRQVARDLNIVLVDGKDPLQGGYLLPRGSLRELPHALARADLIVAIEGDAEAIRAYTSAPIVQMRRQLQTDQLAGCKVAAFCGLGRPERFYSDLKAAGLNLVDILTLPDHEAPSINQLSAFAEQAKAAGAEELLCTEKDKIKLPSSSWPLPLRVISLKLEITSGNDRWEKALEAL